MSEDIFLAAARWHLQADQNDMDWDGFTAWLEAAPEHRDAYDAIAQDDLWIETHRDQIVQRLQEHAAASPEIIGAENVRRRRAWRWVGMGGGLVAAAAAIAIAFMPVQQHSVPPWQSYATTDDGMRTLKLSDGIRVTLSRNSRLEVSSTDRDRMRLTGSAYFDVAHRPDRQLLIQAGNFLVTDIGTRFEISTSTNNVRVSVAEGSVDLINRKRSKRLQLSAGEAAIGYQTGDMVKSSAIDPNAVGSFRRGVLVYQNVPVDIVAAELSRYAGVPVHVDPAIARRTFSGALPVENGKALPNTLARLMDLKRSERNGTIYLSAADRP